MRMNRNNNLMNEEPLAFSSSLATVIGLKEAIALSWVHKQLGQSENYLDGHYWMRASYEEWQYDLPFVSVETIKKIIRRLEKLGCLISANYNESKFDKTKWYRIDYEKVDSLVR